MVKKMFLIIGLISALGGLHLATLREGQEWGDDFSLYVAHARNLAQGRPYAETGYVYNPDNPTLSPRTYPPIFPLLLVPSYLLFGMNLMAMKGFVVLLFTALLGVLAFLLCKRLPWSYALSCLVLFALNPYVWQHKDRLLSETPFMLFAYLALFWAEKGQEETGPRACIWGLLAGAAAYLAFGTRTIGVVLIPSVLLSDGWRHGRSLFSFPRSVWGRNLVFIAAFLAGVAVQKCLLVVEGSYLDQLVFDPLRFLRIAVSLLGALGYFLENGYSGTGRWILLACLLIAACWTVLSRLRSRETIWELFAIFNCILLVFWPSAEYASRFLLPILPLFFLWTAEGVHRLQSTSWRRLEIPAAILLMLAVLSSYVGQYSRMDLGPIRDGVSTAEAKALFDWVQQQTEEQDVFLFPKPRAFALYTGRRALAHHVAADPQRLVRTIWEHGVTHVVVNRSSPLPVFQKSCQLIETLRIQEPAGFDKVYENAHFCVYRLRVAALAWLRDCHAKHPFGN